MTLDFLAPAADPPAASPLEPWLRAHGGRFADRDGWSVAVALGDDVPGDVALADRSSLGKFELQERPPALTAALRRLGGDPDPGRTVELEEGWLWRSSPDRALAVCERAATARLRGELLDAHCAVVELTAGYAAFELRGERATGVLERLTAIDVRPQVFAVGDVRLGTVAHVAATLLRVEPDAYLVLVGAPEALDAWEIALDAGAPLGLRAVGEEVRCRA